MVSGANQKRNIFYRFKIVKNFIQKKQTDREGERQTAGQTNRRTIRHAHRLIDNSIMHKKRER
jgi:hypothetical protein